MSSIAQNHIRLSDDPFQMPSHLLEILGIKKFMPHFCLFSGLLLLNKFSLFDSFKTKSSL